MTSHYDKAKRWRLKFRLRTFMVAVTLVCVYLACWRFTTTAGVEDVIYHVYGNEIAPIDHGDLNASTPMPMIIVIDETHFAGLSSIMIQRRYYFWYVFGVVPLPFQEDIAMPDVVG